MKLVIHEFLKYPSQTRLKKLNERQRKKIHALKDKQSFALTFTLFMNVLPISKSDLQQRIDKLLEEGYFDFLKQVSYLDNDGSLRKALNLDNSDYLFCVDIDENIDVNREKDEVKYEEYYYREFLFDLLIFITDSGMPNYRLGTLGYLGDKKKFNILIEFECKENEYKEKGGQIALEFVEKVSNVFDKLLKNHDSQKKNKNKLIDFQQDVHLYHGHYFNDNDENIVEEIQLTK